MKSYSKWNDIDDSENEDEVDKIFNSLLTTKYKADDIFHEANSEMSYHTAAEMYSSILSAILNEKKSMHANNLLSSLYVSCSLNLSCCFLKLEKWQLVISTIDSISSQGHLLTDIQSESVKNLRNSALRNLSNIHAEENALSTCILRNDDQLLHEHNVSPSNSNVREEKTKNLITSFDAENRTSYNKTSKENSRMPRVNSSEAHAIRIVGDLIQSGVKQYRSRCVGIAGVGHS